ncbi:TPA: glycosyltransferase family 4 protein [Candidatus Berkelbacteria bacterium]|uniref:GDP-mannose-dependent alpha-mannosyltransferase MgtA n=1 Tax=Berkelbacteria bacterium GW2011_GWE1_39_12 TaxID=1618337 RepID=A0A0G4B591_9BACT|nr:MAG: GDP-mannose-dependent alpha-mannosyltransferase MgtA [Berkelbacteria bacterium GW2011_GWE1_39_12]HBO60324.1 glycosyltransferase family 4 protein [Candidatus Berkelbacteria bacterium]
MKIGIVSECFDPTLNGVTVSIHAFEDILEKNNEIYILAPETSGFTDTQSNIFRYPSSTLFGPKDYPIAFPIFAPSITKRAKALGLDIIHAQHSLGMLSAMGRHLADDLDIPIVHTYHTLLEEYVHWKIGSPIGKWFVKRRSTDFCNQCDQIVTPSEAMKKIILGYGVKTPIETIPTGIDLSEFQNPFSRDELFQQWGVPKGKKLLLYLSRVAKEKNLDFLLEVIKRLVKSRNDFHLILVGGGKELPIYQKKVSQMGLDHAITFTDKQEKEKANRFFGAADIFVFPSTSETQGIVISEAMAAGMPAVAVNKMGPSNIIKDQVDGYLCDLNLDQFIGRIESLLNDDNLRLKLGAAARENAKEYSKEASASKMEKLYERTIANYHCS